MYDNKILCIFLVATLLISPAAGWAQVDPGFQVGATIYEILDLQGQRLGIVLAAAETGLSYKAGNEYWRFSESVLLEIEAQESLRFALWAQGEWDDPRVLEALDWQPEGPTVEWSHPAAVRWTEQAESPPSAVPAGSYFGNPTLGGLSIHYAPFGSSMMTWYKLTEGAFMQLEDGAVFERASATPETGSWWQAPIEPGR